MHEVPLPYRYTGREDAPHKRFLPRRAAYRKALAAKVHRREYKEWYKKNNREQGGSREERYTQSELHNPTYTNAGRHRHYDACKNRRDEYT